MKRKRVCFKTKRGPSVIVELLETVENKRFLDVIHFPLAKMHDDHLFEDIADRLRITNTITVNVFGLPLDKNSCSENCRWIAK